MTDPNSHLARACLDVRDLCFARGSLQILRQLQFTVEPGKIVGLVGANGAGKTTLFDLLCGLREPSRGEISFTIPRSRIAYLTQSITVPDALKLGELAELIAGVSGKTLSDDIIASTLPDRAASKFSALWGRRSNSCSYGEKRWFVLVVVLATGADFFILDEPTAGVDIEYQQYVWQSIRRVRDAGKTVLFSTHVVSEVERACDSFFFLKNGSAQRFDSTRELLALTRTLALEDAFITYLTAEMS